MIPVLIPADIQCDTLHQVMKVPLTYERKAEQQHPRNRLEQKKAERFKVVAYKTTYKMMFSYQQVEEMIVNIH